jgi:hypothetical protein
MWEDINDNQETKSNPIWIAEGMRTGNLIWTTNGSYNQKRAANLSGVGWIIFCTKTGLCLIGTFWEKSSSVSWIRAEMLGLCALQLACAIGEFIQVNKWTSTMSCNNKRALQLSAAK